MAKLRTARKLLLGREIAHMIDTAGVSQTEAGAIIESSQSRIAGSFSAPFAIPFNQRSHQRLHSSRKPIAGPGKPLCGSLWPQGPISPLHGDFRFSTRLKTVRA